MLRTALALFLVTAAVGARARWRMLDSGSSAGFRGIHAVNDRVAWASGTEGTVLRTTDGGAHWQKCAVPPGAEKLDFRGLWAWDADNADVMSSGPAEQSRLYKTTDACAHWTLLQTNSEKDGFWDAIAFRGKEGVLIGDPVDGKFFTEVSENGRWSVENRACAAGVGEAAFAASNSSLFIFGAGRYILGTGGKGGPRALLSPSLTGKTECIGVAVPVAGGNDSSGIFSLYFRDRNHGVAVGGDYKQPNRSEGTAAFTSDGGLHWTAASKPPHGYRSSVAWDAERKLWIAAGTNGSDVSRDDGRTWQPLDDGNWNALSPPFIVGPKGRIGRLIDIGKQ
jgi:photosystem II stability/assembly factor-like uncharacterized protein